MQDKVLTLVCLIMGIVCLVSGWRLYRQFNAMCKGVDNRLAALKAKVVQRKGIQRFIMYGFLTSITGECTPWIIFMATLVLIGDFARHRAVVRVQNEACCVLTGNKRDAHAYADEAVDALEGDRMDVIEIGAVFLAAITLVVIIIRFIG